MNGRVEENYTGKIAGLAACSPLIFSFPEDHRQDSFTQPFPFSIYNT